MKNFLKVILTVISIVCLLQLGGCSKVPAGHEGVIVHLYGSNKGVDLTPVGTGLYFLGWGKQLYIFPIFLQNYTWTQQNNGTDESISMQTSEGLSINTDVGITYNIEKENVVKVFQKYRLGIEEITNTFLRNMVRDAMNEVSSTMSVEDLYGLHKQDFIDKVNQIVKKEAAEDGINIDKVYLIGSFRLPESVITSINSKIQASQNAMKVENEVATAKAEAQKTIIEAKARASANSIIQASITPEFLQYQAILRWDGKLPTVTGNSVPFVSLPNGK